jgi:hypothetical protein
MSELYILNPKSQRYISKTSRLYIRLVKEGVIVEPVVEPVVEPEALPEPVVVPQKPPTSLKKKLAKVAVGVIAENSQELAGTRDLDDDQVDQLLKRMLYEKLCLTEKKSKRKPKPKPKRKKKVVVVSSSEEESSDEETSDSDSD